MQVFTAKVKCHSKTCYPNQNTQCGITRYLCSLLLETDMENCTAGI